MNLFVLWTESYGEALKSANLLTAKGAYLLDCSIIGKWSQVMVHFSEVPKEDWISSLSLEGAHKKMWLPELKNQIVESYLSLSTQPIIDFILTIETSFVGQVFELLRLINLDLYPIVDLRLLRFSEPKTLLLLTGSAANSDALLVTLENLKANGKMNVSFEMIRPISEPVKDLFSYSAK